MADTEVQRKACKVCLVVKERIFDGMFDKKNKRWKDKEGRFWNGHTCGECQQELVKENMRKLRKK